MKRPTHPAHVQAITTLISGLVLNEAGTCLTFRNITHTLLSRELLYVSSESLTSQPNTRPVLRSSGRDVPHSQNARIPLYFTPKFEPVSSSPNDMKIKNFCGC